MRVAPPFDKTISGRDALRSRMRAQRRSIPEPERRDAACQVVLLSLLGTSTLALVQLAAMHSLEPRYDIRPMAQAIKQVQDAGLPVANAAKYHAQYQFLGRLEAPLTEFRVAAELTQWLTRHPEGYVVIYLDEARDMATIPARFKQAYRGGAVVLVDAQVAAGFAAIHLD